MFTTQFHVKEQEAGKPIHRRRWRQDESVLKKVLDIDRRFIDANSVIKASACSVFMNMNAELKSVENRLGMPEM